MKNRKDYIHGFSVEKTVEEDEEPIYMLVNNFTTNPPNVEETCYDVENMIISKEIAHKLGFDENGEYFEQPVKL